MPPLIDGVPAGDAGYGLPAAGTPADAPDAPRPRSQPPAMPIWGEKWPGNLGIGGVLGWTRSGVLEPMEQRERMVMNNEYADSTSCVPVSFPHPRLISLKTATRKLHGQALAHNTFSIPILDENMKTITI